MQQLINSLLRNKNLLLFLLLSGLSFSLAVNSHSHHQKTFSGLTAYIGGGLYSFKSSIVQYFKLKQENETLVLENERLKNQLETSTREVNRHTSDTLFGYKTARVIKNSFTKPNNYLLINVGAEDGVLPEMGLINDRGVVGVVLETSPRYSSAISLLNGLIKINAIVKNTQHFGSLQWNGKNPTLMQLHDIPKLARVNVGDTILTGGMSAIFPPNIPIGKVTAVETPILENYFNIEVQLFNDLTNLDHLYVVENKHLNEINSLLKNTLDE